MKEDNKIVHGLWVGGSLSALELLTIHSYLRCGHQFHLWHYDPILTDLPPEVVLQPADTIVPKDEIFVYDKTNQYGHGKGSLAGFSDLFRYRLIYEKGGWWSDMDVTCLKPLDFDSPYIFRDHKALPAMGNLFKCPPKSELMKVCYSRTKNIIGATNIDWLAAVAILNEEIQRLDLRRYIKKGIVPPDDWDLVEILVKTKIQIPSKCYAIHWLNEEWRSRLLNKNAVIPDSTLHYLLQKFDVPNYELDERSDFNVPLWSFKAWVASLRFKYPIAHYPARLFFIIEKKLSSMLTSL